MSKLSNTTLAVLGGGVLLAASMAAPAATLSLNLITSSWGSVPSTSGDNYLLANNLIPGFQNSSTLDGYFGVDIQVDSNTKLKYTFLGWEAAYANAFQVNSTTVFTNGPSAAGGSGAAGPSVVVDQAAGYLNFAFLVNGSANNPVTNGSNPLETGDAGVPNFFVKLVSGSEAIILFDDQAGDPDDDNHDDMGIRVQVVPLPAAAWLFGSALLGMAGIGYRRRQA